jgi:hypothetical protein
LRSSDHLSLHVLRGDTSTFVFGSPCKRRHVSSIIITLSSISTVQYCTSLSLSLPLTSPSSLLVTAMTTPVALDWTNHNSTCSYVTLCYVWLLCACFFAFPSITFFFPPHQISFPPFLSHILLVPPRRCPRNIHPPSLPSPVYIHKFI